MYCSLSALTCWGTCWGKIQPRRHSLEWVVSFNHLHAFSSFQHLIHQTLNKSDIKFPSHNIRFDLWNTTKWVKGYSVGILKSLWQAGGLGALITTDPQKWIKLAGGIRAFKGTLLYNSSDFPGNSFSIYNTYLQNNNQDSVEWLINVSKHC